MDVMNESSEQENSSEIDQRKNNGQKEELN